MQPVCEPVPFCRLLMPSAAAVQVNAGGLPISSSFADVSEHPPTINELTTDSTAKPGNNGVIKGCFWSRHLFLPLISAMSAAASFDPSLGRLCLHLLHRSLLRFLMWGLYVTGFLLQAPAVVLVGSVEAEIKQRERSSISFTYPNLAAGEYDITVKRGSRTSNAVKVTIAAAAAGVTSPQGGPFADTPKFKQTAVPFLAVRHMRMYVLCHATCAEVLVGIKTGITRVT